MRTRSLLLAGVVALIASGCASGPPLIDSMQPEAVSMAARRAQFEMNCPAANAEVISRETIQPVSVRWGVERVEYTIGVAGCGQRATYVVICSQNNSSCFAGGGRTAIHQ
ncbi:hypothetical protein C8R32_102269 [Nitrosospira sp. Nsp5]|uniref:Lipoprotein n=1 Tax=Nitrosospira multiformis TaxID=1231 RepID=A0ABY0TK09_9PROT|nr:MULTISPECIES: hypothetical protein [Nitrosospira]PTR10180.1 hypothetical protein C8R32_102269 [Nitrosospira sp. Nsp5]SDQ95758.1 hypothetical protein SAMN05216402_2989 [Nitrosospira multiformis]